MLTYFQNLFLAMASEQCLSLFSAWLGTSPVGVRRRGGYGHTASHAVLAHHGEHRRGSFKTRFKAHQGVNPAICLSRGQTTMMTRCGANSRMFILFPS